MTIRFLISFLMYFSFSIFAHSQEKGEIRPNIPELISIREEIIEMIDRKEIPSMAVAISKGDTVLWMEALGYADIEKGTKPSISSLYPVGSISKSITATLVMSMINQGEISLSSDIGKLIAPLKILDIDGKQHSVPIWSVMNMTSGVNHGYSSFELESLPKSKKEKINFLKGQIITAFEPGTVYEYSNHSYSILELMIENIRNQRIQLVAPEVLNKIEMTNTLPLYTGAMISS